MNKNTHKFSRTARRGALVAATVALALIFTQGSTFAAAKKGTVDINTASQAELEAVKGVGPATAQKIIANRPYKSLEDLSRAGLSTKKIGSLKSSITVGEAAAPAAAQEDKKSAKETRKKGETAPSTKARETKAAELGAGAPVDLNTSDQKGLEALPGIGPAMAKKIIAARPFKSVEELSKVKGMSKAKVEALKGKVTVGPAPAAITPVKEKPAKATAPTPVGAAQAIDLNTASEKDLESLKGIGPAYAKKIIAARPYKSVEELSKAGLSAKKIEALKPFVTVGPTAATPAPPQARPEKAPAAVPTAAPPAERPAAAIKQVQPGQMVNINTASQEELDSLLGIGPVKAQAIIAGRPYDKIEDIMKVKGIKGATFNKIKDRITVR